MNSDRNLTTIINRLKPISLSEMDEVRFMRRTDTKYVFHIDKLNPLLEKCQEDYLVLEVDAVREQDYETTYFDTNEFSMFKTHHNGKLNRYKVRIRRYVNSNQQFLEIKRKNNRGETIKKRIRHEGQHRLSAINGYYSFVAAGSPYNPAMLVPKLWNNFTRITLVNKNFKERITLDYGVQFGLSQNGVRMAQEDLCIAEIKCNKDDQKTAFRELLREIRILPMGYSKYCIGLSLMDRQVKNNLFKYRIRKLAKII